MVIAIPDARRSRAPAISSGSLAWPRKGLTATLEASGHSGRMARAARWAAAMITSWDRDTGMAVGVVVISVGGLG